MAKKKESAIIYGEFYKGVQALPPEMKAEAYDAYCEYAIYGNEYAGDNLAIKALIAMIRDKVEEANGNYETKKKQMEEFNKGKSGKNNRSRTTSIDDDRSRTTSTDTVQSRTTSIDDDPVSVTVTDTVSKNIKNSPAPSASPSVLEREFESIWAEYPRRQERKDAFAAYCSARKRGTTAEQIVKGVRAYCAYIERNHVDQRYVKQGGTFFRQQGWSDDWSGTFQTARSGTPRQGPDQAFQQRTDDLDALAVQLQIASS